MKPLGLKNSLGASSVVYFFRRAARLKFPSLLGPNVMLTLLFRPLIYLSKCLTMLETIYVERPIFKNRYSRNSQISV